MKVHCVGIGGIGVSALARYYLAQGHRISGSDLSDSEIIEDLGKLGAVICIGQHNSENLPDDFDLVIYSAAVQGDNPELIKARKIQDNHPKVEILTYAQALGKLTRDYFTIAVSGTHGKSTTVSMLSLILTEAGMDPTVIIGTKLKEFGNSNFRLGSGKYLVIEADEWQGSFLNYHLQAIVLTNIEEDHLDYYRDLNHIMETYQEYVGRLPKNGILVFNQDDYNIVRLLSQVKVSHKVGFSLDQPEAQEIIRRIKIPGDHNISNALAALSVARLIGVSEKKIYQAISCYNCCWRRFDERQAVIGGKKFLLVHDYAHHPTEVKALWQALEDKFKDKKIWFIFQPHQHQRTFHFFDRFVEVFQLMSGGQNDYQVILTDIYNVPGRENASLKRKVSSQSLVQAAARDNVLYWSFNQLDSQLTKSLNRGDIVVAAGAGNIYHWARQFHQ